MSQTETTLDREIIARYTDQPERMPVEVRNSVEDAWGGHPVQLYAMTDLDAGMRFTEVWLALGEAHLALVRRRGDGWHVEAFDRGAVTAVRETPGLSGSTPDSRLSAYRTGAHGGGAAGMTVPSAS